MAFGVKKEQREPQTETEKTIEINAQMQGSLIFKDPVNLKINGLFNGMLETCGTLTIGTTAQVEANIVGENIIIAGRVKGDVTARKMLVLMPTAILNGNISAPKLNIVEGALFQGQCQMPEELMNIEELSKYLEIEIKTIEELANTGKIPASKNGDAWKFERTKIDVWASSGKVTVT